MQSSESLNDSADSPQTLESECEKQPPSAPNGPKSDRNQAGQFASGNQAGAKFPPGNWASLRHALTTDRWPEELRVLKSEVDEFIASALADEADDVSTRRRSLIGYRARVHRRIVQLDGMLELRGLMDARGKLRVSWLQQLQSLMATAKALDSLLGLSRKQKHVQSLADVLRSGEQS